MFKKIILIPVVSIVILICIYLILLYNNNRAADYPQGAQIERQLESSIQWLLDHEADVLQQNNAMLWWMLYEAQKIRPDERLAGLLNQYFQRYRGIRESSWGPLFGGQPRTYLGSFSVNGLPYYNQHFVYALNCAADIARELPIVSQQNEASFCHQAKYIYRPACTTHQLMGVNFLLTRQCEFFSGKNAVIRALQQDIVLQLRWDVRVVDVYLQRVLMLLMSGAQSSVKPVWIHQVLDHQLEDGGWGDFDPLVGVGSGKFLGFSSRIFSIRKEKSSFHATAQGVYILSYLLSVK
ncbi:hypothetical protein MNBD_GAMMA09-1506 [hydrothermal vent metagenome]|uniref:Squalene cyclase C-terminal domain-containing protein n=1 Tax=hydrothermal vent metagenome TaxID=652676 RepID=A0A3B0XCI4_9ZZZZ